MTLQFGSEVDRFPSLTDVCTFWLGCPNQEVDTGGKERTVQEELLSAFYTSTVIGIEHSRRSDFSLTSFL